MVFALVLISVVACIAVDYVLMKRRAAVSHGAVATVGAGATAAGGFAERDGILVPSMLYYHAGHTWVAPEGTTSVRIGVDDFARRIAGTMKEFSPPTVGRSVRQGSPIWTLKRDGQEVAMLSPVDGVIEEINPAVLKNPETLRTDPYGEGWVARVRVAELGRNLKNLLHGSVVDRWMDDALERLYSRFGGNLGAVLADGGVLDAHFADELDENEWAAICREHFLSGVTS